MRLFEFIASRIPYKIFSYVLRQILSSFTNKISGVQMGLSLKYQVAIRLCCLVFLLWVDCWDLIRGPMFPDPHGACSRMHPTSSGFIPWWTVYPSRWFLRCVNTNYVAHTCHRGWQGRGDLGNGSYINEGFLFWNW